MASWQARVAAFLVRHRVKRALGDLSDIARVRETFRKPLPAPRGARYTPGTIGGVRGEWVQAGPATPRATMLYLHGGGFVSCSPATHRPLTAAFALLGFRVFVPDYRLAPEHPFPAAVDDCADAWRALLDHAGAAGGPARLALAGDSAGANLALALMLHLRESGAALPAAAALFSPPTDMTGGSPSLVENADRDAMFRAGCLHRFADAYLAGADPSHPLASPLLAELHGLPPILIHVGADEALRDDGVRFAAKARAAGVPVTLQVWPAVPHAWQLLQHVPEARQSVRSAARFLHDALTGSPATSATDPAPPKPSTALMCRTGAVA